MTSIGVLTVLRMGYRPCVTTVVNNFHTSSATYLDVEWRRKRGLPMNPNKSGPLINLPDYTFKDGRPTPYNGAQQRRIREQREYAKKIVQLVGEIDHAVERHARLQKEELDRKQQMLDNRLKPKGQLLLKQNTKKDSE